MPHYAHLATIFYPGNKKAMAAATLMDNRLRNDYKAVTSDIHFDMATFLKWFDYDKLAGMDGYREKIYRERNI